MKTLWMLLFTAALFWSPPGHAEPLPLALPLPQIDHPYLRMETILGSLSDGTSLSPTQLKTILGAQAAQYLDLLRVTAISSQNGSITIYLSQAYFGSTAHGTKIQAAPQIKFGYRADPDDALVLDNIVGLKVKPVWILGWMSVKAIALTCDPAGDTTIRVTLISVLGTITRSITLNASGKTKP